MNPEIDPRLNQLLQKAMARMPADRFQTAEELLYELEYFIYHRGYGPTNETLGKFIRELFAEEPAPRKAARGGTMKMPSGTKGSTRGTQTGSTTRSTTRSKTPAPVRGSSLFDQIKKKLR
jgi:hypothetical protein